MYSPSSYFPRVVDSAIEQSWAALAGYRAFETEMTDALGKLACQDMGIAWQPDSSFVSAQFDGLVPVGEGAWVIELAVVAISSA